jgi:serine phosphatase RsbU (regulator of sigma subunit)
MIRELMARVPLLAALPADEIDRLARVARARDIPAGDLLLREGGSEDCLYVLVDGQVEIVKALGTPDERSLGARTGASFIGEMSLFNADGRHSASVRALTPLRAIEMSRGEFDALLRRQPPLSYEMMRTLSARLQDSENLTIRDLQEKNLQLSQAYQELQEAHQQVVEKEKLERELAVARRIQQSILPRRLPGTAGVQIGARMIPTQSVAGDFYDVIRLDDDRLALVVGDVSGKGVPAAIFMGLTYSLVRAETHPDRAPGKVLRSVNEHLLEMNEAGMFVTVLYGVLDCRARVLRYARAGHDLPMVLDACGEPARLDMGPGQPLGLFDTPRIDEGAVTLPAGGAMLLFTDGVTEASNPAGDFYGLDRLCQSVRDHRAGPASAICQGVWDALAAFSGTASQADDVTLLAVKIEASTSTST